MRSRTMEIRTLIIRLALLAYFLFPSIDSFTVASHEPPLSPLRFLCLFARSLLTRIKEKFLVIE